MKYLALFFLAATAAFGQNMTIRPGAEIRFLETDTTHYIGLKGPGTVSASFVWTLPATDGTAGQALLTNGSGTFYWGAGGSGGALADGDYGDFTVSGGGTVATIDDGIQIDDLTTNDEAYSLTWNGSLEVATKNALYDKIATLADPNTAVAWFDNIRQTFNPGALQPGFNVGSYAGDPGSPINGDMWYDSVANELTARINGASVALGAGGAGSSLTDTYVGYGDGSNALTGEAAFHYNATTNLLTVPGVSTPSLTATSASTRDFFIQDSGDDDYLKIDISTDLASARTLTLTVPDADTTLVVPGSMTLAGIGYVNLWADGVKQTFNPGTTTAGINVGAIAGDPSTPANGDLWYDSTANELTARINGTNVAINEIPPWEVGSFTGTADYAPDTLYVGTMAAPATLTFSTIGSGDKVGFIITATDADAADRTLTFPTASIMGSGSSGTTFVLPRNVDTFLEFIYDGTDLFLDQGHLQASPRMTGVVQMDGTLTQTPAAMGALAVDITKANNTKTVAANSTYTWSATPSVSGQEWGVTTKNSSGGSITITHPTTKVDGQVGDASTTFTVPATGQRTVFFRYDGTDVIKFEGGGSGAGLVDADYGDITVSGDGSVMTIDDNFQTADPYLDQLSSGTLEFSPLFDEGYSLDGPVITALAAGVGSGTATGTMDLTEYGETFAVDSAMTVSFTGDETTGKRYEARFYASGRYGVTIPSAFNPDSNSNITSFAIESGNTATAYFRREAARWVVDIVGHIVAAPITITGSWATPSTSTPTTVAFTTGTDTWFRIVGSAMELDLPDATLHPGKGISGTFSGNYAVTCDPNGSQIVYIENVAMGAGEALIVTGTIGQNFILISDGVSWGTFGGSAAYTQETP